MNKIRVLFEYFKVYVIDFELETWCGENLKCWRTPSASMKSVLETREIVFKPSRYAKAVARGSIFALNGGGVIYVN